MESNNISFQDMNFKIKYDTTFYNYYKIIEIIAIDNSNKVLLSESYVISTYNEAN